MAIIGKIRSYSGLLVIVIGVALAAFVLGDLFKNSGRRKMPPVAEIDGEEITNSEFRSDVEEMEQRLMQQRQTEDLTERQRFQAMQMAWNNLLMEQLMQEEYEDLGLAIKHDRKRKPSISREELMDMITGENPHPFVVQTFKDPKTGQFNPALVSNFLSTLDQRDAKTQRQWYELEKSIKNDRLRNKYYNLFRKGYYLPSSMAQKFHVQKTRTANVKLTGLRYRSIPDSVLTITDEDYESYYEEHKKEFENPQPSAKISYVIFNVNPSQRDFRKIRKKAFEYYRELKTADKKDIPTIVGTIGENNYDSTYHKKGELPPRIDTTFFNAEPGATIAPYQKGEKFRMARLMDVEMRPDSMRASHILIKHNQAAQAGDVQRNPQQAKQMADSIYNVLQQTPDKFTQLASTISEAPAASKQGDLGWFQDGDMLPAFNEGVVNHDIGEIFQTQTRFGYHIVKATGKKNPVEKIQVADIEVFIDPMQETFDSVWAKASQFAGNNRTAEAFEQAVREQNLEPRQKVISPMESNIPGVESPRKIIRWAFDEKTEEGTVSEQVFEANNKYIVALLEEKTEKGIAPLDKVKKDIKTLVAREVRARVLKKRIRKHMSSSNDMYTLASKIGAEVDTLPNISFSTPSIPKFGPEPRLVGRIMSAEEKKMQGPVQGNMGVYVFYVNRFNPAPETNNYARIIQQRQQKFNSRVAGRQGVGMLFNALKEKADIEDNRILYY